MGLGIQLPTDFLKLSPTLDIEKLLSLDAQFNILIDLGDLRSTIQSIMNEFDNVTKDTAKNVVKKAIGHWERVCGYYRWCCDN